MAVQIFDTVQDILGAAVLVMAGLWVARRAERWVSRNVRASEWPGSATLPGRVIRYAVIGFALLAAIEVMGVTMTGLIVMLGAFGLAAGLALQGTLGNAASGLMLMIFRPFKVGDFVDAGGTNGTVRSVNLFTTEMATPDNVKVVLPNSAIWGGVVKNYGAYGMRRLDLSFSIGYEDEINQAMNIIEGVIRADSRVHKEPTPLIAVGELAASSVNLVVRVWCEASDHGTLKFDLTKAVKEAFDRSGVKIPYPQQVVRHIGGTSGVAA